MHSAAQTSERLGLATKPKDPALPTGMTSGAPTTSVRRAANAVVTRAVERRVCRRSVFGRSVAMTGEGSTIARGAAANRAAGPRGTFVAEIDS